VQFGDGNVIDISGAANFCVVRGDSAMIPSGFSPDSTRWWVRRLLDETDQEGEPASEFSRAGAEPGLARRPEPLATQPSSNMTWGRLRVLYR